MSTAETPKEEAERAIRNCEALAAARTMGDKIVLKHAAYVMADLLRRLEAAETDRDNYKKLAHVGRWHNDCRPNRASRPCR